MMIEQFSIEPPPNPKDHTGISLWVDEQIWGHRLWEAQSPWLLFLEFLSIAEARHREGKFLDKESSCYPLVCKTYKRMYLRNILFNNVELARLSEQQYVDQDNLWDTWIHWMNDNAQGIRIRDFSYLKK